MRDATLEKSDACPGRRTTGASSPKPHAVPEGDARRRDSSEALDRLMPDSPRAGKAKSMENAKKNGDDVEGQNAPMIEKHKPDGISSAGYRATRRPSPSS